MTSRVSVSRVAKQFAESGRPAEWFSHKVGEFCLTGHLSLQHGIYFNFQMFAFLELCPSVF